MMAFCFVIPLNGIPKLSAQLFADMNGRRILFVDVQQHLFHAVLSGDFKAPAQDLRSVSFVPFRYSYRVTDASDIL